jgi:hypothetical protein
MSFRVVDLTTHVHAPENADAAAAACAGESKCGPETCGADTDTTGSPQPPDTLGCTRTLMMINIANVRLEVRGRMGVDADAAGPTT